jgi:cytochrome c-type biogenesis protein CcmH/NrfF
MCPNRLKQGSTHRGIVKLLVAGVGYYVLKTEGLEAANEFVLWGMATLGALGVLSND